MFLDPELFIHPTDRAAMKALKAIPGFSQLVKAYMSIWNERQFRIMNMSSKLRISDKQLKKYYDMLPPICEKLGIDVPEIFLELDVNPNAYTYGDSNPFIVVTSGLFETLPEELIPTVLAHECGHIACRHTMYTTMGQMILSGSANLPVYAPFVTVPLQIAFAYWMRCSEYSADRAATIYDGNPQKMIDICMRFSGYDKDIQVDGNVDAFLEQAEEYRNMVSDNMWNKSLEFILFSQNDHPLNAVRAYECRDWCQSEQFRRICNYIQAKPVDNMFVREIPIAISSKEIVGMTRDRVVTLLEDSGFTNITCVRTIEKVKNTGQFQVTLISISDISEFEKGDWFAENAEIVLTFFEEETEEEAIIAHQGKLPVPDSSKKYISRNYAEVINEFSDAGYINIVAEAQISKKGLFLKNGAITRITIAGQTAFEKGDWFEPNAVVRIVYFDNNE